ncbi:MAG: CDP-alcohol phosphatidyltransferase family protein [Vampirovibrionales bacterium]|nr:CDP-alcohol phosphatidyltransferase family protein [Vampirovibrionales bacterium]
MIANTISIVRVALAVGVLWLLGVFSPDAANSITPDMMSWCAILTAVVIWLDGVDGFVARKLNECSPAGAVIDIAGDRIVEQIYWLGFAILGWIPSWMPVVVIIRGVAIDAARGLALKQGYTAFGESTMQRHWLGVWLVSSRASRWLYAASKALAFVLLIAGHHSGWQAAFPALVPFSLFCAWVAVIFCLLRGIPVLLESMASNVTSLKED